MKNRLNETAQFSNSISNTSNIGNETAYYWDEKGVEVSPYEINFPKNEKHFFDLIFDYGDYDLANPTLDDDKQVEKKGKLVDVWKGKSRSDAFSSYRSCFEMRTYRLCRRVLMFHNFPDLGGNTLIRSLNFKYEYSNIHKKEGSQLTQNNAELIYLTSIEQIGYIKKGTEYTKKSLPEMTFEYQKLEWNKEAHNNFHTVSSENLVHAPIGLSGNYQWTDLYNEGINGILTEQANGWFYKSNLGGDDKGNVRFSHAQPVMPKPSFAGLSNGVLQLKDLEANGEKQLVISSEGLQGYFDLDTEGVWQPFKAFLKTHNLDLRDPNIRMLDVNGDGKPELVLSDVGAFWYWENNGKMGYDAPELAHKPYDEELGAAILFADQEQRIFLADMSGDGLTDIVRIRNAEVCYWANMGYGRFAPKVTMDNAPVFDHSDMFNPSYLQLADISGTGATDIIYLGKNKFKAYLNCSGNRWTNAEEINPFFPTEQPNKITVTDLLGNGTACIVWSSELPAYSAAPIRYIDLMGGKKPHIMCSHENSFGKKTEIEYKSSTYFYLKDKLAGTPWITKLAFPVQVVSRSIVSDLVTGARFVNTYTYHHGYYDHAEREFRGFGRVDQRDTEDYDNWLQLDAANGQNGAKHHQPPVLTRTWFHTGAYIGQDRILKLYEKEYWYNHVVPLAQSDDVLKDALLDFPDEIPTLTAEQHREAARACKGMALRQEVFALDGSNKEKIPYSVATHTCFIRPLQPRKDKKNGVFIVLESEALNFSYERKPEDARVEHTMNLEIDKYAQVKKAVSIVYGRKEGQKSTLPNYNFINSENFQKKHQKEILDYKQRKTHVILTENDFTHDIIENKAYRLPVPCAVKTFECQGIIQPNTYFTIQEVKNWIAQATPLSYENTTGNGKRLIEHIETCYLKNDLSDKLDLGVLESFALPFEAYQLAFTPAVLRGLYNDDNDSLHGNKFPSGTWDSVLVDNAKYEKRETENYWISSGKPIFINKERVSVGNKTIADIRTAEQVKDEFYLPIGYEDPFETKTWVKFDPLLMYIQGATDALGNETAVEDFDFRTLSPKKLRDINGNFSEAVTDALGMVVATAIYSKPDAQGRIEGDTLEGGDWVFTQEKINEFFTDPHGKAAGLLKNASACLIYDLDRVDNLGRNDNQPTRVATITRETHFSQLQVGEKPKYQISIEYSDGLGNVALKKVQAEAGKAFHVDKDADGDCQKTEVTLERRWIGNGRTVLNNKGKPIKQYEPYFSDTPNYEDADCVRLVGVTATLYYDAVGRPIKTKLPDGTLTKVEFDAWEQRSFDQNDTIEDEESTWKNNPTNAAAYAKSKIHDKTPSIIYLDSLGRPFFSLAHNIVNGQAEYYPTYVVLDIEGNVHQVIDSRNNPVMTYKYDMLGHRLYQDGMDNGERWMLNDCMGKPVQAWDENDIRNPDGSRALELRELTTDYDILHRPTDTFLLKNGQPDKIKIEHIEYGTDATLNLIGQVYKHQDGSGQTTNVRYDFKGNLLETQKQMPANAKVEIVNWETPVLNDDEIFTLKTEYDALNRMSKLYNWHRQGTTGAVYVPQYNTRGVLESEKMVVRGETTEPIRKIEYNEKGQRTRIQYGGIVNPDGISNVITTTRYDYDLTTFRLMQLRTTRHNYETNPDFPIFRSNLVDNQVLQQLIYTYDPVGNITEIEDQAYEPVFFNNQEILSLCTYEYDALYRLIKATGKENITFNNAPEHRYANPANLGEGALRNYTQTYAYDAVGNIRQMRHFAGIGRTEERWTRDYNYNEDNNRLLKTETNRLANTVDYRYDIHGNMLNMHNNNQDLITWEYRDMIQRYNLQGGGMAYYQYGNDKNRSRKLIEKSEQNEICERIYLGGYELYRCSKNNIVVEEIETHHLFADEQRILIVEDVIKTPPLGAGGQNTEGVLYRYQYSNHLGSATLELNENAIPISYEEYHPYGTTAYHAQNADIKAAAKRYRYTGMERDEETGLNYHAARYYAVWLGRWVSCDPIGIDSNVNIYSYSSSPTIFIDTNGQQSELATAARHARVLNALFPEYFDESFSFFNGEGVIAPRTLADNPLFRQVATQARENLLRRPPTGASYDAYRAELNRLIRAEVEAGRPLSNVLEIAQRGERTQLRFTSGPFTGEWLEYAHDISRSEIRRDGLDNALAIMLENLRPVGDRFHREFLHLEQMLTRWGRLSTPEARAAIRTFATEAGVTLRAQAATLSSIADDAGAINLRGALGGLLASGLLLLTIRAYREAESDAERQEILFDLGSGLVLSLPASLFSISMTRSTAHAHWCENFTGACSAVARYERTAPQDLPEEIRAEDRAMLRAYFEIRERNQ